MIKLPILSGKKLLKILQQKGYRAVRKRGSHVFVEDQNGIRITVIPIHSNEDLGRGLLKSILNDLDLSAEDILDLN
ncbi:type II toxin-antitoxin system HicA family toxin [Candidatus Peregrinibacteria bacterium]|nr:type II toxin-antitoxin system HicA family toxin [Candidatus Peregrinibacteria bacterium]